MTVYLFMITTFEIFMGFFVNNISKETISVINGIKNLMVPIVFIEFAYKYKVN